MFFHWFLTLFSVVSWLFFCFLFGKFHNLFPQVQSFLSGFGQKFIIPAIRGIVMADKASYVDFSCPGSAFETFPLIKKHE